MRRGPLFHGAVNGAVAVLGLAGLLVSASPVPLSAGAAQAVTCQEPYLPLYGYTSTGSYQPTRTQVWPDHPVTAPDLDGTDLDHVRPRYLAGPDTDGDGAGDKVEIDLSSGEQVMVITRGDGVVRVGLAGSNLGDLTSRPVGDLDADGHDEVLFLARPAGSGTDRIFVLPGATAPGSYQADDVAVEIPTYFLLPIGDQVGAPGDDVAVAVADPTDPATGHTVLVSGADIMAPGPGGALQRFPTDSGVVDGAPSAVVDLGGPDPTLVTVDGTRLPQMTVRLWHDGTTTRFTTAGPGLPGWGQAGAVRTAGATLLTVDTADRGGGTTYVWDLDDPCRRLGLVGCCEPPLPGRPAPAPAPARPLPGAPSFTG